MKPGSVHINTGSPDYEYKQNDVTYYQVWRRGLSGRWSSGSPQPPRGSEASQRGPAMCKRLQSVGLMLTATDTYWF